LLQHGADPHARLRYDGPGDFQGELNPGATPLHVAAVYRTTTEAEILLEHGADPNARDDKGWPPLFNAGSVWVGDREPPVGLIEVLLDHGADLHATDPSGRTVMDVGGDMDPSLAEYLADEHGFPLSLAAALHLGRVGRAREILADPRYRLPAERDARLGLLLAVLVLYGQSLFAPGEPNPSDRRLSRGQAAAARRRIGDHLDILQALLDRGILDDDRGSAGGTVLDVLSNHPGEPPIGYRVLYDAVRLTSPEPAELLIRHGVRPGSFVQALELRQMAKHPPARSDMLDMLTRHGITGAPPPEFDRDIRQLSERLRSPVGADRLAAVRRLRDFSAVGAGPYLADAAPALRGVLNDPSAEIRELARATLECVRLRPESE
ncbi:MAG TPA: ankyrin repeat domain-containing protein, partial [Gemmataceae bacterium]|nr:ankyrin repeat domain-containing protein [Gemmataceae bacterium]